MAVAKKKRKKLTNREKTERAEAKKRLQERGVLPPDKPRLNRTKFAEEVVTEFNQHMLSVVGYHYVLHAIGFMVGAKMTRVTSEEVGVLKVLKAAVELKKFHEARKADDPPVTIGELDRKSVV